MNVYLFAGYSVIWTIFFVYLLYLLRKQKRVNEKLESLSQMLERGDDH